MLVNQIVFEEPLISENRKPQLKRLVYKLIEKLETNESDDFYLFKVSETHTHTYKYTRGGTCVPLARKVRKMQYFDHVLFLFRTV